MTARTALNGSAPPMRPPALSGAALFGLLGGPLAWFLQLCAGYILASWPCFPHDHRRLAPLATYQWSWPAMIALLISGVLVALAALLVSWRTYARTSTGPEGQGEPLGDIGSGRRHFLALWGVLLGAGFAVATSFTAIGYGVLPRCAG